MKAWLRGYCQPGSYKEEAASEIKFSWIKKKGIRVDLLNYLSVAKYLQIGLYKYLCGIEILYVITFLGYFFLSLTHKHRQHSQNTLWNTGCEYPSILQNKVCFCLHAIPKSLYWKEAFANRTIAMTLLFIKSETRTESTLSGRRGLVCSLLVF